MTVLLTICLSTIILLIGIIIFLYLRGTSYRASLEAQIRVNTKYKRSIRNSIILAEKCTRCSKVLKAYADKRRARLGNTKEESRNDPSI